MLSHGVRRQQLQQVAAGLLFLLLAARCSTAAVKAFESDEWIGDEEPPPRRGTESSGPKTADADGFPEKSSHGNPEATPGQSRQRKFDEFLAEVPLEHCIASAGGSAVLSAPCSFSECGSVSTRLIRTPDGLSRVMGVKLKHELPSPSVQEAMQELIDSDGMYRVRFPTNLAAPGKSRSFIMAAVKARCLAAAGLKEKFEFALDGRGNLVAVSYIPLGDCLKSSSSQERVLLPASPFTSLVELKEPAKAPRLTSTLSFRTFNSLDDVEVVEAQPVETKPPPEPEKTFWQKYWMYIIPLGLVFINAMVTAAVPEQGGAAGQGGGQRAGGASVQRRR
eukprot:TRINITY_DN4222_c0_g1_i1.p1 TRINITY_DN4222_c0_g1~~TRINITY_DN4222_c0_g1_i1.p1  ORF type:complete len:335 (+),score=73.07 TRINITY_DN4222_c0_g1_i1:33-1037(+)